MYYNYKIYEFERNTTFFHSRPSKARSEQRINGVPINGYNVESSHNHQVISPTSEDDVDIFDSHCFATTPSSSNASDVDEPVRLKILLSYDKVKYCHIVTLLYLDFFNFNL